MLTFQFQVYFSFKFNTSSSNSLKSYSFEKQFTGCFWLSSNVSIFSALTVKLIFPFFNVNKVKFYSRREIQAYSKSPIVNAGEIVISGIMVISCIFSREKQFALLISQFSGFNKLNPSEAVPVTLKQIKNNKKNN